MRPYQQVRFYDPFTDSDAVRLSVFDDRGDEYWSKLLRTKSGRATREAREEALAAIEMAIDQGLTPGEVRAD